MKIVILTAAFPPEGMGGTEIASYNIAKSLAEKGHDVHIVTSGVKRIFKEKNEDNFFVHRISYPRIPSLGILFFWLKTFFYLKKINSDIIHSQSIQMGLPCFLAKIFFKKKYIVWCQGSDVYLPWKFKKIISKVVLNNADLVIVLTEDMKKKMQEIYRKDIPIIPNGINLKNFEGLSRETIRGKLKIGLNEKIIIFVGSLETIKGLEYLIMAFRIIKDKMPGVKLILVGAGEGRQKLERLAQKNNLEKQINFVGNVLNSKIPEYMAASDIFVLPSLSEGLPLVILEAMASGLPIVASKVRGISEILKEGENGFLAEAKNPEQIAEKILYLFSENELRKRISLKNKETVKRYSLDLITGELLKIYSFCLKNVV